VAVGGTEGGTVLCVEGTLFAAKETQIRFFRLDERAHEWPAGTEWRWGSEWGGRLSTGRRQGLAGSGSTIIKFTNNKNQRRKEEQVIATVQGWSGPDAHPKLGAQRMGLKLASSAEIPDCSVEADQV